MKDYEVIRYIENHGYIDDVVKDTAIKAIKELHEYRAIGTIEEFKALKEKNVAKKIKSLDFANCPCCNEPINAMMNYCIECGQKLDWND